VLKYLEKILLFANLDEASLLQVAKHSKLLKVAKETTLFYEGDTPEYLYIVLSGQVKLYKTLANESELILKYFHPNELIAEVAVFEGFDYPATAETIKESQLLQIDFKALKELFISHPDILLKVQLSLMKKIKNLEHLLSRYLVLDAKGRVIEYILENPEEFFTLKQHEVATLLNITPETLSRILKPFKSDGIIDIKAKHINIQRLTLYKEHL